MDPLERVLLHHDTTFALMLATQARGHRLLYFEQHNLFYGDSRPMVQAREVEVQPVQGALDCGAGYEFWLARQALARNSAIKLYGLQWSAPSWVSDGHGGLWSTADVRYVVGWLKCARANGLTISYVGGWNEHYQGTPVQQAWFVNRREY